MTPDPLDAPKPDEGRVRGDLGRPVRAPKLDRDDEPK
jgi:hypothetical protein